MFKLILGIIFILIIIVVELNKYFKHKKLVGLRVRISYRESTSDNSQEVTGFILKKIKIGSGTHFIVKLNQTISYLDKNEQVIIIKEKGQGDPIGTDRNVEIHIYLPLTNLTNSKFSLNDFEHIGWGIITPENY